LSIRALSKLSVWIRIVLSPSKVTIAPEPVSRVLTALLPRSSKLSTLVTEGTRNSVPPRNSRPMFMPFPSRPIVARTSSTAETAYQSF